MSEPAPELVEQVAFILDGAATVDRVELIEEIMAVIVSVDQNARGWGYADGFLTCTTRWVEADGDTAKIDAILDEALEFEGRMQEGR